jgi:Ca2+:H+ antiporter
MAYIGARKVIFATCGMHDRRSESESEILVASVETTGKELGFGELLVGAIIVGTVGNAAEHSSSILFARKGEIELSIHVAAGSGTQLVLFVVPILLFSGIAMGQYLHLC